MQEYRMHLVRLTCNNNHKGAVGKMQGMRCNNTTTNLTHNSIKTNIHEILTTTPRDYDFPQNDGPPRKPIRGNPPKTCDPRETPSHKTTNYVIRTGVHIISSDTKSKNPNDRNPQTSIQEIITKQTHNN